MPIRASTPFIRILIGFTLVLAIYVAYAPGFTGGLFYDDQANLRALASIHDLDDAKAFVFGGTAGPLGRPIALASFLSHASSWPDNSPAALRINTLIHIANAALLLWLGYLILKLRGNTSDRLSFYIAISAAGIWAILPILASSSLITVQRMTGLSAFFGLVGLVIFVWAYRYQESRPNTTMALQALGLGLGTLLGLYTKESAALIPVFALVIDATLLGGQPGPRAHILLRRAALWITLIAILVYLSPLNYDWFRVSDYRGFSPFERLLGQPVILWQYLHLTFFPKPTAFGPFHDHIKLTDGWALRAIAILAFATITAISFWFRRYSIWPLFALLWFFVAHLLESTTLLLELYFEHRNYLAVYGFFLTLSYAAWTATGRLRRLGPGLLAVYGLLLWSILFGLTSLWGNPHHAAESWAARNPASARAALHLGLLDYKSLGGDSAQAVDSLLEYGRRTIANRALDRTAAACPSCLDVRLQALLFACGTETQESVGRRFEDFLRAAETGRPTLPIVDGVFPLRDLVNQAACPPLSSEDVRSLIEVMLANPGFSSSSYRVRFHFVLAALAQDRSDHAEMGFHLEQAERLGPEAMPVLQFQVYSSIEQERFEDALNAIERRRPLVGDRRAPNITDESLDELEIIVQEAAREAGSTDRP